MENTFSIHDYMLLLLSTSLDQLQRMLNELNAESKLVGLQKMKTKVIFNQFANLIDTPS